MLSMFFGNSCTVDVEIDSDPSQSFAYIDPVQKGLRCPIFSDGSDISGTAFVTLKPGKHLEHGGIKVEVIGQSDTLYNKTGVYDFFVMSREVESPGTLTESRQYKWKFSLVGLENETYWGVNIRLYYFVRVTVSRGYGSISKESNFAIQNTSPFPPINSSIKMEVGIEDALHIEFEYNKAKYHLQDVIIGKVYFLLVAIEIKHMEIVIQRVESITLGRTTATETIDVAKFEIMDGSPVKGESIPVRMYLSGLDICPTYRNVQNKLSVQHYINLVIVDEEERRYFKKQEIELWRSIVG